MLIPPLPPVSILNQLVQDLKLAEPVRLDVQLS